MRNAFVCCTPYHLIVTLHMIGTLYKEDQNDIYISNHFESAKNVYQRLLSLKTKINIPVKNVYFIEDKEISYDKSSFKINKIKGLLTCNISKYIKTNESVIYTNLFLFTHSFFSNLIVTYAYNKNKAVKINFVEEGRMSYVIRRSDIRNKIKFFLDRITKVIKRRILSINIADKLLLFQPDLYTGDLKDKVSPIPSIKENPELKGVLNDVFNYQKQTNFNHAKYIFFDQSFAIDSNKQINEYVIVNNLTTRYFKEDLLIKLHPRDSIDKYKNYSQTMVNNSNFPWELIYLNEDLYDKVLISVNSSAVFTPKIVFGRNHKIIILKNIYGFVDEELNNFIKLFDHNKNVFQPSTSEELKKIINSLKSRGH